MKRFTRLSFLLAGVLLLLSACSQNKPTSSTNNNGFFHHYFVNPFASFIHYTAHILGGNYGLAIVVVTLIIRLVLMPLTLRTFKNQQQMKAKMDKVKPEMDAIQAKIKKSKSKEEQMKLQQEMMGLYRKHGVNPLNMGCLPVVIQMPILMGFYYAIRGSSEIASHSFLWFSLGKADIAMAIIAGIIYFFQFRISLFGMPEEQQKQMKFIGLLSPIMILFVSFSAPAALPLYWTVSGGFLVIQTYISKKFYQTQPAVEVKGSKNK
jgi:YidC/Oxa1 family membrane protein insertase